MKKTVFFSANAILLIALVLLLFRSCNGARQTVHEERDTVHGERQTVHGERQTVHVIPTEAHSPREAHLSPEGLLSPEGHSPREAHLSPEGLLSPEAQVAADSSTPLRSARNDGTQGTADGTRDTANVIATEEPALPEEPAPSGELAKYELGVYGTLGLSQLVMAEGSMQPDGVAPGFGADFTYYFAQHWGITAGVEAAYFNMRLFSAGVGVDNPGDASTSYLLKRTVRLHAAYLRVPLWLRFRTPAGRHEFQAAAGGMFDLALAGRQRTETERRTGSSPANGTEITTASLRFGHGVSLAAEAGWRWRLGKRWGLYTGVYGGYGLSNVLPSGNALPGEDNIRLLSVGAKVKIAVIP
jgi:hypothetical protein